MKLVSESHFSTLELQTLVNLQAVRTITALDPYVEAGQMACQNSRLFVPFLGWCDDSRFIYIRIEYIVHSDMDQYIDPVAATAQIDAAVITL